MYAISNAASGLTSTLSVYGRRLNPDCNRRRLARDEARECRIEFERTDAFGKSAVRSQRESDRWSLSLRSSTLSGEFTGYNVTSLSPPAR